MQLVRLLIKCFKFHVTNSQLLEINSTKSLYYPNRIGNEQVDALITKATVFGSGGNPILLANLSTKGK